MTLYKYLLFMAASSVIAWIAWGLVVFNVDPFVVSPLGHVVFYVSLWFAVTGTLSLVGFFLRRLFQRDVLVQLQVTTSFRQAVFLGVLLVVSFFLQSLRILTWWNLLLFVFGLSLLEYFFTGLRRSS